MYVLTHIISPILCRLIRDHFHLNHLHYSDMSPVLIPRGYTKSYLDGEIDHSEQMADIRRAYLNIVKSTSNNSSGITIIEGTGHAGVSIFLHTM